MAILYKPFKFARTVFYVLSACFFLAGHAFAQTSYTVEGVEVDVTAASALDARNQAFAKAQQDAFLKLAAQFLPETEVAGFRPPDVSAISPMIQDYEVTKEKLSSKRYIGTYTFRFKERAVQRYFQASAPSVAAGSQPSDSSQALSSPFKPAQASGVLVVPFYRLGGQSVWDPDSAWMQAWRRAGMPKDQVLPLGDLFDVEDIRDEEVLRYDASRIAGILSRYSAKEIAFVTAVPDAGLVQAGNDRNRAAGGLRVEISRSRRGGKMESGGSLDIPANPGETTGQLYDRAVLLAQRALQSGNAPVAQNRNTTGGAVNVRVAFSSLQEWTKIQRSLSAIPGVEKVVLKSLSPHTAQVALNYNGDADTLRLALQQKGMDLSQPGGAGDDRNSAYDLMPGRPASPPPAAIPSQRGYSTTF